MTTYYAAPTGTGNDSNSGLSSALPKTLLGATTIAATSGDTIMLLDGVYQDPVLPAKQITYTAVNAVTPITPPGWTVPDPVKGVRHVMFKGTTKAYSAPDCVFTGIHFKYDRWVDTTTGGRWADVSAPSAIFDTNATTHAPVFNSCEFSWGYGPNQEPFNVTLANVYPEYQSGAFASSGHNVIGRGDPYQSWWMLDNDLTGSAIPTPDTVTGTVTTPNGRAYNTIANAPFVFKGTAGSRPVKFYNCYFHDIGNGIAYGNALGPMVMDGCRFERYYRDALSGAVGGTEDVAVDSGLQLTRTLFEYPFGRFSDSGNPHSDVLQHFNNRAIPSPDKPILIPNVRIERNFMLIRPGYRGSGQFIFLQGAKDHNHTGFGAVYLNPIIRDNITLQMDGAVGVTLSYAYEGDYSYNQHLHIPGLNSSGNLQIEVVANPYWRQGLLGVARLTNNLVEGANVARDGTQVGNIAVGPNYASIPATNVITGPIPDTGATSKTWYAALRPKAPYTGRGPRYETLESFLLDPLSNTNVVPFVGYKSKQLAIQGSAVRSAPSYIRGPIGNTVGISVNTGSFQIEEIDGTVVSAWRTTPLANAAVGKLLVLEHNAANSQGAVVNQVVTLTAANTANQTATFSSTTQTATPWPTVHMVPGALDSNSLRTDNIVATDHPDNNKFTYAMWFKPNASANNHYVWGTSSGGANPVSIFALPTNKFRVQGRDSNTASLFSQWDSSNVMTFGHEYLLIISMDLSLGADGLTAKGWNMTDGINHLEWGTPAAVVDGKFGFDVSGPLLVGNATIGLEPDIDYVYFEPRRFMNAKLASTAQAFSKLFIGPDGQGPFGTKPWFFAAGPVDDWESASGINRGYGPKFTRQVAGMWTAVDSPTFPPQFNLNTTKLTEGTVIVDEPIDILVQPEGYTYAMNVHMLSDKKGTWSENPVALPEGIVGKTVTFYPYEKGVHSISTRNEGGHIDPAPVVANVLDPYTYIAPGASANLTTAQLATLQLRTFEDNVTSNTSSINLRWKRSANNSGYTDGINFVVNVNLPGANAFVYSKVIQLLTSYSETPLNLSEFAALIPNGNSITVNVPTALNNITINYTE